MIFDSKSKKINVGLSITREAVEVAVFSPKSLTIEESAILPTPPGMLDREGDRLENPALLQDVLSRLFKGLNLKPSQVNLSVPGTVVRMVDMPKLTPEQLMLSLSSEAERYKSFDNTDAILDFKVLEQPNIPNDKLRVIFAAIRMDTLQQYASVLKSLKIKINAIDVEPMNVLRAMAATGVLDSLAQQIGPEAYWGVIFSEPSRLRISLWQGNQLIECRETLMDTVELSTAAEGSIAVDDLMEEIRRSCKNIQPTMWFAHQIPTHLQALIANRQGVPVSPCQLGPGITLIDQQLSLTAVGCAVKSNVEFPFGLNLTYGGFKSSNTNTGGGATASTMSEPGGNSPLIGIGAGALILALIVSAILWGVGAFMQGEVTKLTAENDSRKATVAALTTQETELKAKVSVYQKLKEELDKARIRNQIYVSLTDDLRNKSPEKLWIQEVDVNGKDYEDKVAFQGKALAHEDVIDFARSFDGEPYVNAVAIDEIQEESMGSTPVFNYKIKGDLNLNKDMLEHVPEHVNPLTAPLPKTVGGVN